jgi:peroxiredoxin
MNIHDLVPDFAFQTPDGGTVRLSDHAGHPVVLIFLRHLA